MGQVISSAFPTIIEAIKGSVGLNESVKGLERQVNQLTHQLADLQTNLTILEVGGKRKRNQEVVSWIEKATKLINDFPTLKERAIQGQWWEKYLSIDGVKKMREAVEDVKNDLRTIGEITVVDVDESTIPSQVDKYMNALKRQVTQLSSQADDIATTLRNLERQVTQLSSQAEDIETALMRKKRKLEDINVSLERVEEMKNKLATVNIESITSGKTSLENVQTMREAVEELRDDGKNIGEHTIIDVDESTIPYELSTVHIYDDDFWNSVFEYPDCDSLF